MADIHLPQASPVSPDAIVQAADKHDVAAGDLVEHLDHLQRGIEDLGENQFYTLIHEGVRWHQITETEYQYVVWPQTWSKVLEDTGVDNREENRERLGDYTVDEILENREELLDDEDVFRQEMEKAMRAAHRNHLLGDNTDQYDEILDAAHDPDRVIRMSDNENGEPFITSEITLEQETVTFEDIELERDLVALCVAHDGFDD